MRRFGLRTLTLLAVAIALTTTALLVSAGSGSSASPSVGSANPRSQGRVLVQRFFTLLREEDSSGLNALLAPSFQVVRANGGVQNKASYLADPPKIDRFRITKVKGTRNAGALVVSYQLTVIETIGGIDQPTKPSPRLSVFHRQNGAWRLVAHANFNAIRK